MMSLPSLRPRIGRIKCRTTTDEPTVGAILRQPLTIGRIRIARCFIRFTRLRQAVGRLLIAASGRALAPLLVAECVDRAAEGAGLDGAGGRRGRLDNDRGGTGLGGRGTGFGSRGRGFGGRGRGGGDGDRAAAGGSVPVGFGVVEAGACGNAFPAFGGDEAEVVACEVGDRLLDDVVLDGEVIVRPRGCENAFHDVLRVLDLRRKRVEVVLGVEIEIDAMVTQGLHVSLTAGFKGTLRIGRSHVCRVFADYIGQGTFILGHLLLA